MADQSCRQDRMNDVDIILLTERSKTIDWCMKTMKRDGVGVNGNHTPIQTLYYTTLTDLLQSNVPEMQRYAHECNKEYAPIWNKAVLKYFENNPTIDVLVI